VLSSQVDELDRNHCVTLQGFGKYIPLREQATLAVARGLLFGGPAIDVTDVFIMKVSFSPRGYMHFCRLAVLLFSVLIQHQLQMVFSDTCFSRSSLLEDRTGGWWRFHDTLFDAATDETSGELLYRVVRQ
jgi:hypothetical protein